MPSSSWTTAFPVDFHRFRLLYTLIYRNGSRFVHPSTHAVAAFVHGNPPHLSIADERPLGRDLVMIGSGALALGLAIGVEAIPALELEIEEVRDALA